MRLSITWQAVDPEGVERLFEVEATVTPGTRGKLDGHPDDRVAPEGPLVEDLKISYLGYEIPGRSWEDVGFTEEVIEQIQERFAAGVSAAY